MKSLYLFLMFSAAPAMAQQPFCPNAKDSLPDSRRAAGAADSRNPIEHVIIVMQENHSFDNYFGRLNQSAFYGAGVDGVSATNANPGKGGDAVHAYHEKTVCVADPEHDWNAIHHEWNGGRMDGFVSVNGEKAMGYYDQRDLPFYYDLANKFAIGDRYFCSSLTQTFPNRFYLYAGTSFGHVKNDLPFPGIDYKQETIFDRLDRYGVSWKYYKDGMGYLDLFQPLRNRDRAKIVGLDQFAVDLRTGALPQVALLDSDFEKGEDEHPKANIQTGQQWLAERVGEFAASPYWRDSVLFVTYDEGGGFYDHVAPPAACRPDDVEPRLGSSDVPGHFDRLGVRVPFLAISPFVKHHFVSHATYDHTSILKFVEQKWNLPALTARDANADGFSDLFDFAHPDFAVKPDPSLAKETEICDPGNY